MNTPSTLFQSLRDCQARSVAEQRLLSGRGWLFAAGVAQLLTALHPINQYLLARAVDDPNPVFHRYPVFLGGMVGLGISFFFLWWWAAYAPFRSAVLALAIFLVFHAAVALGLPHVVLDSIASKILVLLGLVLAVHTGWLRHRAS